jgi:methylamine dehydrogenase accessory protein MauD
MMDALIVSNVLLWILVCVLALVVVALTRQIGLLHERVAPAGALAVARGPAVGETIEPFEVDDLDGRRVRIGGVEARSRKTLLFFLSPTCPVCATLLPTLQRMIAARPDTRLVYASDGPREEHEGFRIAKGLRSCEYVLSRELGLRFEVSKLPHAVLLDEHGTIRAKGLVNTREHLESLFEADRLGVASLQEYLAGGAESDSATALEKGAA